MATAHFNVSVSVRLSVRRESSDVLFLYFFCYFYVYFWVFRVYLVTVAVIFFFRILSSDVCRETGASFCYIVVFNVVTFHVKL